MFTLGSNFNCCTVPGKNLCIVPPSLSSESAPRGSTYVFQGFENKVLTLQISLYWAAVLIPTIIALKHLMPVSSMWPIRPLVIIRKQNPTSFPRYSHDTRYKGSILGRYWKLFRARTFSYPFSPYRVCLLPHN